MSIASNRAKIHLLLFFFAPASISFECYYGSSLVSVWQMGRAFSKQQRAKINRDSTPLANLTSILAKGGSSIFSTIFTFGRALAYDDSSKRRRCFQPRLHIGYEIPFGLKKFLEIFLNKHCKCGKNP